MFIIITCADLTWGECVIDKMIWHGTVTVNCKFATVARTRLTIGAQDFPALRQSQTLGEEGMCSRFYWNAFWQNVCCYKILWSNTVWSPYTLCTRNHNSSQWNQSNVRCVKYHNICLKCHNLYLCSLISTNMLHVPRSNVSPNPATKLDYASITKSVQILLFYFQTDYAEIVSGSTKRIPSF